MDWADEKAAEIATCGNCCAPDDHDRDSCDAHLRPAIAQALRDAYDKGRDDQDYADNVEGQ